MSGGWQRPLAEQDPLPSQLLHDPARPKIIHSASGRSTLGISDFVNDKLAVASALATGRCGGDYVDAVIIMASLVSAMASDLWPGTGIDRRRFIELWARYGAPEGRRVSVPLLIQFLRDSGRSSEADMLTASYPSEWFWPGSTMVIVGDEVDISEAEVLAACPNVPLDELRRHAYPTLFYENVRCGGVHEYQMGREASSRAMTIRPVSVSYVNELAPGGAVRRHVHFHPPWLRGFIWALANNVDARPSPARPSNWWIDGAA